MRKYFDKAFFRLLFSFVIILAISFAILAGVGYYQYRSELVAARAAEALKNVGNWQLQDFG